MACKTDIVQAVKEYVLSVNKEYADHAPDHYNFWEQHIQFVVKESLLLAEIYNADQEIVELGALLHDIALMTKTGERAEHHANGKSIAAQVLSQLDYPSDQTDRVLNCILHHRSSKNAENIEELCVADADILAHFDHIPMCFHCAYRSGITSIPDLIRFFAGDYADLSDRTKEIFKPRYQNIMNVLFGAFHETVENFPPAAESCCAALDFLRTK